MMYQHQRLKKEGLVRAYGADVTRHRWWNRWVLILVSSVENPVPKSTTMGAGRGLSDHLSRYSYDFFISCGKRYFIMSPLFPSAASFC